MADTPATVPVPVPIRRTRRYGVYQTQRAMTLETAMLRHNVELIDAEATRLGITRSEFMRWATLQLAASLSRARGEELPLIDE